jgi:hypothetical protein
LTRYLIAAFALLCGATIATAQEAVADLETSVHCAAVFGVIAGDQQRGALPADAYPQLGTRGREFFVQIGARLIDELQLTREQARARFASEVAAVRTASAANPAALQEIARPCLALLDAALPPAPGRSQ